MFGDIDREGDIFLSGQTLPSDKCPTCGKKLARNLGEDFPPEAPRNRVSKTIKVPKDAQEDGVQVLEDLIEQLEERINPDKHRPAYYTLCDSLSYTLLNSNATDFE